MTDLIQQLEAWAGKMTAFGELTAEDMLNLLRPVIEAAVEAQEMAGQDDTYGYAGEVMKAALADLRAKLGEE